MSDKKSSRADQQEKKDRLYLRIKPELKERMQDYCTRRETSMSQLVTRFFVELLEAEEKDRAADAESF